MLFRSLLGSVRALRSGSQQGLFALNTAPLAPIVATGDGSGRMRLWDAYTGQPIERLGDHEAEVGALAFSRDGSLLASGGNDGLISIWQIDGNVRLLDIATGLRRIHDVTFSPGGTTVVGVGNDGAVLSWNAADGTPGIRFDGQARDVFSVEYTPDGASLITAAEDGTLRMWNVVDGTEARQFSLENSERAYSVALSPDGQLLAAGVSQGFGDEVGIIKVWNALTGDLLTTVRAHNGRIGALSFTRDGSAIISGSIDGSVAVWRLR